MLCNDPSNGVGNGVGNAPPNQIKEIELNENKTKGGVGGIVENSQLATEAVGDALAPIRSFAASLREGLLDADDVAVLDDAVAEAEAFLSALLSALSVEVEALGTAVALLSPDPDLVMDLLPTLGDLVPFRGPDGPTEGV